MIRSIRVPLGGLALLLTSACASAPGGAPLPAGAGPAEVRAAELQDRCHRARAPMRCYSEALLAMLEQEGVSEAMETLEKLGERDVKVRRDGHMYAHAIGLAASPSPHQVGETFRECRPSFQSGCYHGVIQSYFAHLVESGRQIDEEAANALCADYHDDPADRWLLFQCVHGMGHGLTMLYEHHLPSALAGCDLLSDDWDREGCYGGAFMENIVQATVPHHAVGRPHAGAEHAGAEHAGAAHADAAHADHTAHTGGHAGPLPAMEPRQPFPPLDRRDPLYPCSVLEGRYLVACYQMQTSAILYHNGGDVAGAAAACDQAPEAYRGPCYLSLGRDISAITLQDHDRARRACEVGDPRYRVWCHTGYVKNLVDLTADPADAMTYCRGVATAELKQACYHAVGEQIWVLTNDRRRGEQWCELAESAHRESCRRGAGLASWRDEAAEE